MKKAMLDKLKELVRKHDGWVGIHGDGSTILYIPPERPPLVIGVLTDSDIICEGGVYQGSGRVIDLNGPTQ